MSTPSVFEAEVEDLTSNGQGVVRYPNGLAVFVVGVWPGERVKVKIFETRKRFALAKLIEIQQASAYRRQPPCVYHDATRGAAAACGGCAWMFVTYEAQLAAKQRKVEQAIARVEQKWLKRTLTIWGAGSELEYRNRVQFKSDGEVLGFLTTQSHQLVDIEACLVLKHTLRDTMSDLRAMLPHDPWRPSKKHNWVTLDVDESVDAASVSVNQRLPFKQANDDQNIHMKNWLRRKMHALLQHHSELCNVVELFCGSGNFTEVLAEFPVNVVVAECNEAAISAVSARFDEKRVKANVVDLFDEEKFEEFIKKTHRADILFLDPPRDGLKVHSGLFSKAKAAKHVLYISCDLATFTRDLTIFNQQGYRLKELQPIDVFPNTPHVELMAHLKK